MYRHKNFVLKPKCNFYLCANLRREKKRNMAMSCFLRFCNGPVKHIKVPLPCIMSWEVLTIKETRLFPLDLKKEKKRKKGKKVGSLPGEINVKSFTFFLFCLKHWGNYILCKRKRTIPSYPLINVIFPILNGR